MIFVREVGWILMLVLKGGSTSLQVVLLPYSHRTYNEDKKSRTIVDSGQHASLPCVITKK